VDIGQNAHWENIFKVNLMIKNASAASKEKSLYLKDRPAKRSFT
jgi:hypothetical protein